MNDYLKQTGAESADPGPGESFTMNFENIVSREVSSDDTAASDDKTIETTDDREPGMPTKPDPADAGGAAAGQDGSDLLIFNNGDGLQSMDNIPIRFDGVEGETRNSSAGQEGNDLLIVNNGDGSDFLESGEFYVETFDAFI